jgi:hypothetical protein
VRVLVLDPGERVGWASAVVTPWAYDAPGGEPRLDVTGHGIAYLKDMAVAVYNALVLDEKYDVVVFEQWRLTAKGARVSVGSEMESSQFIGMVRLACWVAGVKIVKQPTSALSSADRSLKCGHPSAADVAARIAAADKGSHDDGHDGSALRHLWTYFFKEFV